MVDTGSCGLCRLSVAVLEVDGTDHADLQVPWSAVVDPFDPVPDREPSSTLRRPEVAVVEPDFIVLQQDSAWTCLSTPPVRLTD